MVLFGYGFGTVRQQGGTRATYSGNQDIIRRANTVKGELDNQKMKVLELVVYNPTSHGIPVDSDGSSAKVLVNNYTDEGSRVNHLSTVLTIEQSDTSKNNTVYVGWISVSFNEGRLDDTLMTTYFGSNANTTATNLISSNSDGEMSVQADDVTYTMNNYLLNDQRKHFLRGLDRGKMDLYSGRVITANNVHKIPRKNRRQQEGSLYAMCILNDSGTDDASSIKYRLDTFFKEIPSQGI